MPRVLKEKQLPKTIEPANWRKQAEARIEKAFPKGIVQGALRLLKRPEIEQAIKYLVLANARQFERFDTDDGNGIDLCGIVRDCLEWGEYQPDPNADLAKLRAMYRGSRDIKEREYIFNQTCELASSLTVHPRGRRVAAGKNQLILSLDFRMKERLRGKPCYEAIAFFVKATFDPSRKCEVRKEAAAVKRALTRMKGKTMINFWKVESDIVLVPTFGNILTTPK